MGRIWVDYLNPLRGDSSSSQEKSTKTWTEILSNIPLMQYRLIPLPCKNILPRNIAFCKMQLPCPTLPLSSSSPVEGIDAKREGEGGGGEIATQSKSRHHSASRQYF